MNTFDHQLKGCTPEPLMSYLKALGVLRLVSEQIDPDALGCWQNDVFTLRTKLTQEELVDFFLHEYKPTPILGPWAGGSGFFGSDNRDAVNSILQSNLPKFSNYVFVLTKIQTILDEEGLTQKPDPGMKEKLLKRYRDAMPDIFIQWMDATMMLHLDGQTFSPLLGTGGNDGRLDFSQNFMQRLVLLFISKENEKFKNFLYLSLFGSITNNLLNSAIGQFSPGRSGGPNASQGMSGNSMDNPWDYVLMLEGAILFTGAITKRYGLYAREKNAFPFTVRARNVGEGSASDSDSNSARGELWLPIWTRPVTNNELMLFLSEGRAECSSTPSKDSIDFAKSIASLGVDRGIDSFVRYGFLNRSGKAYLATAMNRFIVPKQRKPSVDLISQVDRWLSALRSASSGKNVPTRYPTLLKNIESAIFDYCRYGENERLIQLLIALGVAERQLGVTQGKVGQSMKVIQPLSGLSRDWVDVLNPHSVETRLALAIAGVRDAAKDLGSIRCNMEHVEFKGSWKWSEVKQPRVVWNSASLSQNLTAVLQRRMMDAQKASCSALPIRSNFPSGLNAISLFLANETDDQEIDDLLWGIIGIDLAKAKRLPRFDIKAPPLPRAYALLKLLFLPREIVLDPIKNQWRFAQKDESGVTIRPEPRILPLLRSGRLGEACRIAYGRLISSGFQPLPGPDAVRRWREQEWDREFQDWSNSALSSRIAAALIFPITSSELNELVNMVTRKTESVLTTISNAEGEAGL